MSIHRFVLGILAALPLILNGCGGIPDRSGFIPPEGKYNARILRDDFGVPHVFGKTDADAAYALAFAHCEDDPVNMEDAVLISRASIASVRGMGMAKFDYIMHLFRVREFVEAKYATDLSPEVRAVCDAYAEGINHFAATYPEKMPHIELPVKGEEIVMGFTLKAPFFYELHTQLERVMNLKEAPPVQQRDMSVAWITEDNPYTGGLPIGSNSWAVGPKRSADGHTRLAVNSHQPWNGPVAWYEAHIHSEEGWNMHGGTFPGGPMIFSGHDANKGWCHTVNRPDLSDVFVLKINPDNPDQYEYDGEWKDLEIRMAPITVRFWGGFRWTVKRECLWSVHGPAIRNDAGVFAFRFAGLGEVKMVEQWFRMNKATNFDEFYKAMEIQGLPAFNCMYADKTGKLFYAYNGKFPKRLPGFNWKEGIPGDKSEYVWEEFLPFTAVPQMQDPESGFMQTCNSTPFKTTDGPDNPVEADFPAWMGVETHQGNRSTRALEVYGGDDSITAQEFFDYKHDTAYAADSREAHERDEMLKLTPAEPELKAALEVLRAWNLRTDKDNVQAPLGFLSCVPPSSAAAALGLEIRPYDTDRMERLRFAVRHLQKHFGQVEVPWGDFCRLRRGSEDEPLAGAPDVLRAIDGALDKDGRFAANYGDGLYMFVDWAPDGTLHSTAVHNYGAASTDPESPHYADQVKRFAETNLRKTLLTEADVREHLSLEYRPGEFKDAWYVYAKAR
ncbi:MAG: hypothetical protein RLZZ303_2069 [Candidatus Hydrogenedentota bacterium]|jgi:penicillin amidase/acyl-homoserine-lactone acylase